MPSKKPFTPAGVDDKIEELYALSDALLQEQAEAAKTDFPGWLNDNFSFTDDQAGYLADIDPAFTDALGYQFSLAIGSRLPVSLIQPTPIDKDDYSSKILQSKDKLEITYNSVTGFKVTGELELYIGLED